MEKNYETLLSDQKALRAIISMMQKKAQKMSPNWIVDQNYVRVLAIPFSVLAKECEQFTPDDSDILDDAYLADIVVGNTHTIQFDDKVNPTRRIECYQILEGIIRGDFLCVLVER